MRRYLIIAAVAIVVIGGALALYFYFFATGSSLSVAPPGSATLPTAGNSTTSSTNPSLAAGSAEPSKVTPSLVRIDTGPVVPGEAALDVNVLPDGMVATSTKGASTTPDVAIEYLERESGNVYSYLDTLGTLTRISDRTIPGIQNAAWLASGSGAFVQYLSGTDSTTINTYLLPANGVGGFFLPQDLDQVSIGASSVLTLASGVNGSLATVMQGDGSHSATAFSSPLTMLRVSFLGTNSYLAFTKPTTALDGYVYAVDGGGNFSRLAGPLPGLVALASPKGTWVLVSYSSGGVMDMELVNVKTRETIALPLATIADKCVWTADESAIYCGVPASPSTAYAYPDDWYQGAVSFNDTIWKIDVNARLAELTLNFTAQTNGGTLDAEALAVDPNDTVLTFVNKSDGSLWAYQLQ
jgi:hypothetical protein